MDIQKYLIIIKGEDKTEEITNYIKDKFYIHVKYKNSDNSYVYTKNNFKFYKNPIEIDINKNKVYLIKGYIYNVEKVLKFENYYRIFFKDTNTMIAKESEIRIIPNDNIITISSNKFEYFKQISKIVGIKTENGMEVLAREYEKINFISRSTALYKYMTPIDQPEKLRDIDLEKLIFPFGANKSQFEAVRNAMSNQISIIEGPPRNRENSNNIKYYSKYYKKWKNGSSCFK